MFSTSSIISCNFSPLSFQSSRHIPHQRLGQASKTSSFRAYTKLSAVIQPYKYGISLKSLRTRPLFKISSRFLSTQEFKPRAVKREEPLEKELDDNSGEQEEGGWTTSILLFALWAALMYYVFNLAPNQTPSRDMYFLQKLLNLRRDDGFRMNEVLVSLWYIMGLWPVVYSMLLLPTGRSSKSKIPVWPFLVLSFFGGFYTLLPYFAIWRPPSPATEESELSRWPLILLESKITAAVVLAVGVGIISYATATANADVWKEFYQYFRESRFIHVTCLDFSLLSAFSPFWVYNDMTARRWFGKGSSWVLPASVLPFIGPALYLLLRPSLPTTSPPPAASPLLGDKD